MCNEKINELGQLQLLQQAPQILGGQCAHWQGDIMKAHKSLAGKYNPTDRERSGVIA
jgi:hypothetical protein